MRITLTLGGRYSNLRAEIPVPLDDLWARLIERLTIKRQARLELERMRELNQAYSEAIQLFKIPQE